MKTGLVVSVTDELVAELEALAIKATPGNWATDGDTWVCANDSDQLNNGFVLAICEGPDKLKNAEYMAKASPLVIRALLAERAELLRDAGRFRLFASTVVAEFSGAELSSAQHSLFDAMNACDEISNIGEVEAMFDAAMQSEAKP